jgi:uncharacterized repeat protein (TIGR03943 family)
MTKKKFQFQNRLLPWLDILAIMAWGILILKYWLTGKLNLLIHPDYFWLAISGGLGLLIVGCLKSIQICRGSRYGLPNIQHINIFPPGWSSCLLLTAAILGLLITPRVFASQTALERGVTESIEMTRAHPQAFRVTARPEERTLVDWVRTLNVYPEPDAYTGQKVKVQGFVIHPPDLDKHHLLLARFVITCCAADAYPAGLPVKLSASQEQYPADSWLEVEGQMVTENLAGKRQLTINSTSLKQIPQPKNPYTY